MQPLTEIEKAEFLRITGSCGRRLCFEIDDLREKIAELKKQLNEYKDSHGLYGNEAEEIEDLKRTVTKLTEENKRLKQKKYRYSD